MNPVLNWRVLYPLLAALLLLAVWLSLALGSVSLPLADTLRALLNVTCLNLTEVQAQTELIVSQIRLPRTLLGLMVGEVLALTSVAKPDLFCKPLTYAGLIGVI